MKFIYGRTKNASHRHWLWILVLVLVLPLTTSFLSAQEAKAQKRAVRSVALKRYIVKFREHVKDHPEMARALERRHRFAAEHIYRRVLKGFSARFPEAVKRILERHPDVAYIEPDRKYYAIAQITPTGVARIDAETEPFAANVDVDIAILDSGIDLGHPDLNVTPGRSTDCAGFGGCVDGLGDDGFGHGTHVAGTAAAISNDIGVVGVAPGARLWSVRVLDDNGSGWTSWIIAGIDWVTANADEIEVANMSLGGQGFSNAMQEAIQRSVAKGVVYVVAAGNDFRDVYGPDGQYATGDDFTPAAYPEVAAISALADSDGQAGGTGSATSRGPDDSFATFSNFSRSEAPENPVTSPGAAIDLMCPGVDIVSTYLDGSYATGSGTSMSSPHAAGLVALYIAQNGRANNAVGVYAIRQALIDAGVDQDSALGLAVANDPDSNPERLGMAGPVEPITDLSIANIAAPETVVKGGPPVDITVTVRNVGAYDVDLPIEVKVVSDNTTPGNPEDDLVIGIREITQGLATGQSADITFNWDINDLDVGLSFHAISATLMFEDDNDSNNSDSVDVEVRAAGQPTTIHIGDMDGSSRNVFWIIWLARVTMAAHDTDHNPVAGATIYGTFDDGSSIFQCTTNANGRCSVQGYQWFRSSLTFTVTDVYHVDLDYEMDDNHDPEGDSDGTKITVRRP